MIDQGTMDLVVQFTEQAVPFNRWMGMQVVRADVGEMVVRVPFKDDLIGDPFRPAIHGGIISSLIDATGGGAVFTQLTAHDRASTVDLRVDYLRPGKPADLYCHARTVRLGNRVAAVSATVYHEGHESEPIAMGMAVYNIRRQGHKSAV